MPFPMKGANQQDNFKNCNIIISDHSIITDLHIHAILTLLTW